MILEPKICRDVNVITPTTIPRSAPSPGPRKQQRLTDQFEGRQITYAISTYNPVVESPGLPNFQRANNASHIQMKIKAAPFHPRWHYKRRPGQCVEVSPDISGSDSADGFKSLVAPLWKEGNEEKAATKEKEKDEAGGSYGAVAAGFMILRVTEKTFWPDRSTEYRGTFLRKTTRTLDAPEDDNGAAFLFHRRGCTPGLSRLGALETSAGDATRGL